MSDLRDAFEAWYNEEYVRPILPADRTEGGYQHPDAQAAWDAWQAALSANGGEEAPVGYTGSGSLDAMKQGAEGHIFPSPAPSHPIPLYLGPTVKESLTVQSEPIGYADPDTLADYRAGDRLHMPVYRPDASEEWQSGIPVYLHPAPQPAHVPEIDGHLENEMAWAFIESFPEGEARRNLLAGPYVKRGLRAALAMLTAAPSGDAKREAEIKAEALESMANKIERECPIPSHDAGVGECLDMIRHEAARLRTAGEEGEGV